MPDAAGFPRAAFIGLGIMGAPMAGHLLRAGYALQIHSRTRARAAELERAGGVWCDNPSDAARGRDVLLLNLPDSPDVETVLFGPRGAAEALPAGSVVVDFSTISPAAARSIADRLAQRSVAFLDAPVTGGQVGAQGATLTIMVGGDAAAFERVRPVLERLARTIVRVGPSGAGQALKACNQIMCAVNMIGVCEAIQIARASGLDLNQMIETLSGGAGGSWALSVLGQKIAAGDLKPAFMIRLMQKDLRIAQALGDLAHAPLPGTALAQQLFRAVEGLPGGAELGTQGMIRAYERLMSEPPPRN